MSDNSVYETFMSSPEHAGTRRNSTATMTNDTAESGNQSNDTIATQTDHWPAETDSIMRLPLRSRGYSDLSVAPSTIVGVPPPTDAGGDDARIHPRVNLTQVNEGLIGQPMVAPGNSPAVTTPTGAYIRSPLSGMATINESLEHLPEQGDEGVGNIYRSASLANLMSALTAQSHSASTESSENMGSPLMAQGARPPRDPDSPIPSQIGHEDGIRDHSPSLKPLVSAVDGVLEETDWQDDVMNQVEMSHSRLVNLARDKHRKEPNKSSQAHYLKLLRDVLSRSSMDVVVNASGDLMKFAEKVVHFERQQHSLEERIMLQEGQLTNQCELIEACNGTVVAMKEYANDQIAQNNETVQSMQNMLDRQQEILSAQKAKISALQAQNEIIQAQYQVHVQEMEMQHAELSMVKKLVREKLKRQDQSLSEIFKTLDIRGSQSAAGSPLVSPIISAGSSFPKSPLTKYSGTPTLGSPAASPEVKPEQQSGSSSRRPSNYDLDVHETSSCDSER